jgi:hypothetical protein
MIAITVNLITMVVVILFILETATKMYTLCCDGDIYSYNIGYNGDNLVAVGIRAMNIGTANIDIINALLLQEIIIVQYKTETI